MIGARIICSIRLYCCKYNFTIYGAILLIINFALSNDILVLFLSDESI